MSTVTVQQMREIERRAFDTGMLEAELMERAGMALGRAIGIQYVDLGMAVAYIGKGHNAGDALIALRVLKEEFGWKIGVRAAYAMEEWAGLTAAQWEWLGLEDGLAEGYENHIAGPLLMIDGLVGIGAKGALTDPLSGLAEEMKRLRNQCGAVVVAVDNPSGVDPDSGEVFSGAVMADRTLMIGAEKRGLLFSRAVNFTGQLGVVAVEGLKNPDRGETELICPQNMDFGKSPRAFDFHKGKGGRVGIVAGSVEFTGAALLTALGAVRSGAGLVTLYVRSVIHDSVVSRLPYEVMLKRCDFPDELLDENLDAIVIGPGLGVMTQDFSHGLSKLIAQLLVPTVIDADGLNFMAKQGLKTHDFHVLTPHPGEFAKLAPNLSLLEREQAAHEFVGKNDGVLLLKGSRTIVAKAGKPLRVNSTGTPAMSNGGQGDLLSGVIGALLAGGMDGYDAAAYGAWLCGHAAEMVQAEIGDVCPASETALRLGQAMRNWRCGLR